MLINMRYMPLIVEPVGMSNNPVTPPSNQPSDMVFEIDWLEDAVQKMSDMELKWCRH